MTEILQSLFLLASPIFWLIIVLGLCIGSFLNVCILRIPEGTFFKNTRSVCPACSATIPVWLNIPILSWLLLRGKARCCGASISIQYPMVELVTSLFVLYTYWQHPFLGWSVANPVWSPDDLLRFTHGTVFVAAMMVCAVIDMKYMIIPDVLSLGMVALSPAVAWVHPDLDLHSSVIGILAGGGFLYAVAWLYWLVRKQYGMGFGDVKLLAAIGGWLGYQAIFPTLFIGSIVGSIIGVVALGLIRRFSWQARIPFGPFLAAGAVMHLWWGGEIFHWLAGG